MAQQETIAAALNAFPVLTAEHPDNMFATGPRGCRRRVHPG
jgi:hypothetical protein